MGGGAGGALRCRPRGEGGDGEPGGIRNTALTARRGQAGNTPARGPQEGPPPRHLDCGSVGVIYALDLRYCTGQRVAPSRAPSSGRAVARAPGSSAAQTPGPLSARSAGSRAAAPFC